jgi:KTSC domain
MVERVEIMDRKAVDSSMLASIGYEAKTQTLELEFNSGEEFEGLMNASSHGSYARNNIIGDYAETRVSGRKSRR